MAVDISKIKPGDEVTVRAKVTCVGYDLINVTIGGVKHDLLPASEIVSHTPRELEVGDRVRVLSGAYIDREGAVIAKHDHHAWVWVGGFGYVTNALSDLERIP